VFDVISPADESVSFMILPPAYSFIVQSCVSSVKTVAESLSATPAVLQTLPQYNSITTDFHSKTPVSLVTMVPSSALSAHKIDPGL
jgi:hypothetical protein